MTDDELRAYATIQATLSAVLQPGQAAGTPATPAPVDDGGLLSNPSILWQPIPKHYIAALRGWIIRSAVA
jgi:hypothetical protein